MYMKVVKRTGAIRVANRILHRAGTIVDTVDKLLAVKESDCTGEGRFVYGV